MNLIRRNPSAMNPFHAGAIEDQFGRMVEHMFNDMTMPFAGGGASVPEGMSTPRLDVEETDQAYEVQAELPGVKKDDVKVSIDGPRVTIEAECRQANEQRQGEQRCTLNARHAGTRGASRCRPKWTTARPLRASKMAS